MGDQEEHQPRDRRQPSQPRTGSDQPIDPEDLVRLAGQDPTPERIERARRLIREKGAAAVEEYLP
ncbi:hypothetical protein IHE55_25860 [Streptomyces pactum]|uniref:Uncharacterized protein n=1 Tax=Streptomyces pactum TaxID=68249 RepID=A0ABS0NS28_9ACTN|nr:hypothetical protein [Streptomyces pactum]MBH5338019.1 hypothetical protein [Streptomyces pactum]